MSRGATGRVPRRVAGWAFRRAAAPLGLRAIDRALDDGLPGWLGPPLCVLLGSPPPPEVRQLAERIEQQRVTLRRRTDVYRFVHHETSSGWARWADDVPEGHPVTLEWLASGSSVPRRCGTFLALCARAVGARTVLELGAGTGISGAYLASGPMVERFITIEGSPPLARLAAATIRSVRADAAVVQGAFAAELPRVLERLRRDRWAVDLAFVDGHHDGPSTVRYVDAIRGHLRHGSVVILDDIRLWRDMWDAWRALASAPGIAAAVDTGRFGVLVIDGDASGTPRRLDLARYTGAQRVGPPRPATPSPLPRAAHRAR